MGGLTVLGFWNSEIWNDVHNTGILKLKFKKMITILGFWNSEILHLSGKSERKVREFQKPLAVATMDDKK